MEAFAPQIEEALEHPVDFKSALQERLARRGEIVGYTVVGEQGPPHDRTFTVSAAVDGERARRAESGAARRTPSRRPRSWRSTRSTWRRSTDDERHDVYLKSITVKGFKSFPDRTRLEFGPGTSVIVGPNGSGKSNVTDAVLWALGEQSPVAVRGQSMQDVIFGGAPGRQAATSAEVELVLDDSDGTLGLGVPEISIYRRLDRSGEGEYRLAGARCRLVEVMELLSDTGLGKEMHSVISQGRVESLVTSKPRERRMLIEEAAGLGKHRKRRRRAQLKLARTQDNLDRALDVEREARSRLATAQAPGRGRRAARAAGAPVARDPLGARPGRRARPPARAGRRRAGRRRDPRAPPEPDRRAHRDRRQRREQAEEALAARSAQREELSRRAYAARSAGERIGYRADSIAALAAPRSRAGAIRSEQIAAGLAGRAGDRARGSRGGRPGSRRWSGSSRRWSAIARPSSRASSPSSSSSASRPRARFRSAATSSRPRSPPRREAEQVAERCPAVDPGGRARCRGCPSRGGPCRSRARCGQPVPARPRPHASGRQRARRCARGRSRIRAGGRRGARRPACRGGRRRSRRGLRVARPHGRGRGPCARARRGRRRCCGGWDRLDGSR